MDPVILLIALVALSLTLSLATFVAVVSLVLRGGDRRPATRQPPAAQGEGQEIRKAHL